MVFWSLFQIPLPFGRRTEDHVWTPGVRIPNSRRGRLECVWVVAAGLLLTVGLQATPALGQSTSYVSPNPTTNGQFGGSIAGVGDLNDDGTADVMIGAPGERVGSSEGAGRAYVFSGKTGEVLHTLRPPTPTADAFFGTAVAEIGDVTGDGIPDVAIAEMGAERQGEVYVFSGRDGTIVRTHRSPTPVSGGLFGRSLAGVGDVDGDAVPDLAVGAIGEGEDRVYVFSGGGGERLYTLSSPTTGHDHFGQVAALNDVDGDGVTDLLVGASTTTVGSRSSAGRAYIYSGRTGERRRRLTPPSPKGGHFAYVMAAAGDVNGDGVSDAIVGEVGRDGRAGYVYVYDGSDGTVRHTLRPPAPGADGYRGYSVRSTGDVTGDGTPDVVLGTRVPATDSADSGTVCLYDTETGRRQNEFTPPGSRDGERFGATLGVVEEKSGDAALLVGAPGATVSGKSGAGRVYRYSLP